ncbi:hypothetical protein [Phocoenobacter skyensis]|uniref:Uncharacterized protein n=2 Tax=Phocoenobacter skyensis TaxID=97481 RepID=A0ABT9JME2_9PAST|nr:hypothetical protein [Pasteurella skyensis]MDP8079996.1 hypothetical protein [Pasteurella skyensis]MDP8085984.1 hypothetical protein [Pasteurella skyensis]MDP8185512.1 hypothetical protein [Pasteurella skyensis]
MMLIKICKNKRINMTKNSVLIIVFFSLFMSNIYASHYKLSKNEKRDGYDFFEFQHYPDKGKSFKDVFDSSKATQKAVYLRMLGEFSPKTNKELFSYYEKHIPQAVMKKALKSSGNMHNPAIQPLNNMFDKAFKTTSFFKEIISIMEKHCYKLKKIEREKFNINTKTLRILQPDIWLYFDKLSKCNQK